MYRTGEPSQGGQDMASIFKITAGAAVVATALYAAAGYLAVPTLVKSTLADTLGKQLGRSVTVTNVAFNPWTCLLYTSDAADD